MAKRLAVVFPYDLRASLDTKLDDSLEFGGWVAFVNNAGTLVHVVHPEETWLIRIRFHYALKHCSKNYIERTVRERLERRLIL